jgi:hypothetical protein
MELKIRHGDNSYRAPAKNLKYNEVCFLAAHNAHASKHYGYWYYQQTQSIRQLLDRGVRGLLLDIYPAKKTNLKDEASPEPGESMESYEVMLWHGPTGRDLKKTYYDVLRNEILPFLRENSSEVVTIVLEDYCPLQLSDAVIDRAGIGSYVLKPSDWNPQNNNGWPTLQWMIDRNKRLVIFTSKNKQSVYMYPQWRNMVENQYGEFNVGKAAVERGESQNAVAKKYLLSLNYFGTFSTEADPGYVFNTHNTEGVTQLINKIIQDGLNGKYKNRYPNFINLDYVHKGYGLAICNFINDVSVQRSDRATTIFRPLE